MLIIETYTKSNQIYVSLCKELIDLKNVMETNLYTPSYDFNKEINKTILNMRKIIKEIIRENGENYNPRKGGIFENNETKLNLINKISKNFNLINKEILEAMIEVNEERKKTIKNLLKNYSTVIFWSSDFKTNKEIIEEAIKKNNLSEKYPTEKTLIETIENLRKEEREKLKPIIEIIKINLKQP